MKIVLNKDFGGFSLSKEAYKFLGKEWDGYGFDFDKMRTDEKLIECVETLGKKASGFCADLEVIEIPDNSFYEIDEYDGLETIYYSNSEINVK